ncbi:diaminopimelate epimerase [Streptomyces sp. G-G2]|uniref:diaminopimelate epimerase n=1 Tax=Streptomyces sp. G-G2 TaxID=3046201 RepID=UPI0024B90686|nr:diaminopimelate epimerase [Streptomyces sp. G-G2]MDJ0380134.1 diaminopimelate epimerase [Streptomyces sp. G-G2]
MSQDTAPAVDFAKYEALGNDYIVIDPRHTAFDPTPENVRLACDRHFGLGADGLLYGPLSADNGFRLRIFNPDGTECEKSGNGLRIFARYLREAGHAITDAFTLHSLAGPSAVRILDGRAGMVRIDLGPATTDSRAVGAAGPARPMLREPLHAAGSGLSVTCVQLGNPHCVVFLDDEPASEELARRIGPAVRDHELFTQRVNVELLNVIDRENIRIEIYERGAGYTLSSGSSACTAAFAAHARGLTGTRTTVHMPGGRVTVEIDDDGRIALSGEVRPVLRGHWAQRIGQRFASRSST